MANDQRMTRHRVQSTTVLIADFLTLQYRQYWNTLRVAAAVAAVVVAVVVVAVVVVVVAATADVRWKAV